MSNAGYICFHLNNLRGSGISQIRKNEVTDSHLSAYKPDKDYSLYLSSQSLPVHSHSGEPAGKNLILNPELITKLEEILQLSFIYKEETGGNVCMAGSEEVRPDFRESFTLRDLLNYILGFARSKEHQQKLPQFPTNGVLAVPLPKDSDDFWKMTAKDTRMNLSDHPGSQKN